MDLRIFTEPQQGATYDDLLAAATAPEAGGFSALFRSDHFTNPTPPDEESLELWVSLAWLASHTERIEFGPLVTPMSFRHPVWTARMGKDVDDLSGGRLVLGVGAGWQEREHEMFGFDLLDVSERLDRFEEGVEVIHRLLHDEERVTFHGEYFHLQDAVLLPRPQREGGPPLLIGGNGENRTLPLAARLADEWNGVFLTPARARALNQRLDELLEQEGRAPGDVRRSLMTNVLFGRDDADMRERLRQRGADPDKDLDDIRANGNVVGTANEIVDQLGALAEAGMQRVMLQWLDLDDMDGLAAMAAGVLPQLAA